MNSSMVGHVRWKRKLTFIGMQKQEDDAVQLARLHLFVLVAICFYHLTAAAPPMSDCYALDRNGYLYDFTDKIGKELEFTGQQGSDLVVRFCEDVQNRSQNGYVNYGRFDPQKIFMKGSGEFDFLQVYRYGDLVHCEHNGYNLMGREAEVNIICGVCYGKVFCKDDFGCICNISYHHKFCRVKVVIAINCSSPGSHILPGLSIGFNPKGWEVVNNGITQSGFYRPVHDFSYGTEQKSLYLYLTAASSVASTIGNPYFQVTPNNGLSVELFGTAATSAALTAEAPTIVEVNWQCEISRERPYEVSIVIPLDGYDSIIFYLCKLCENQDPPRSTGSVWATFVLLSFIILGIVFCCVTFLFREKFDNKDRGGSSCYPINQDTNAIGSNSWDGIQFSKIGPKRVSQFNYGTL